MSFSKKNSLQLILVAAGLIILNLASNYIYKRFDLTQDKRYTLSEASKEIIYDADSPIIIDVFLEGNFPPEFQKLKTETKQLLEEFKSHNSNISFEFLNPLEGEENPEAIKSQLFQLGIKPAQVAVQENGKTTTELVYPWALAYYNEKTVKIPLLVNQLGATSPERVNASIQNLEYAFTDGFNKLLHPKEKKIAILKGNGELEDRNIADFLKTIGEYYRIAPFTLDSVAKTPQRTNTQLKEYDLVVVAKPTDAFTDSEKYVLDQYTMSGGKSLWLFEQTTTKIDSINGDTYVFPKDLNLNDLFFKYGLRVNANLVKDVYSAPITLASGTENESQYNQYPWFLSPLTASGSNHPIVTNIEAVKFDKASAIDTLPNSIKKTILLSTSPLSKKVGLPFQIDFDKEIPENLKVVNEGPKPSEFDGGEIPLAVLLEGKFESVFKNRIKPFKLSVDKTESVATQMIVISDGDIIKNQFDRNRPLELGFDKLTNTFYGNKEFLLNCINYLLDDDGLINIRSKEISIPFLDPQKTAQNRNTWQILNLLLPLGLLAVFGIVFQYLRKRKYTR
ncbi:gliding motility-associated ABC transporter substrate-binding protein GldG [Patiriisocius hiemis]|uniref:Gliding motility-associated ABC transporter substrate-binding protein GldG n=1 Tax=Patiriisocius hiemis TaxID=3075604 RepID=A0ABU2YHC8_9FLAO|nr:gliding motility-associated ABC transporter substrate-binding protein GldG [Constantimarinum sp. W242]MDT0556660.1 gliding motility-associated ABC transporter substrate-binding protein GldG [Constantimarinum sp. W242]